jgi:hypothetical protein
MAVETAIFGGAASTHPIEVDIVTHNGIGQTFYPLVRIDDPQVIGISFFIGNRWSGAEDENAQSCSAAGFQRARNSRIASWNSLVASR